MKIFKRIILGIIAMILLVVISVFIYIQLLKPSYSGIIKVPGAENTEVYFDTIGVPHIYADTEEKAMIALGYVHAKERLWQMELLRRIASGRLAEILGKDLLKTDVFFKSLGIDATVEKQVVALEENQEIKKLTNAYLKGVNNYIDNGTTPIEFTLLGIEKEHYTVKDMYYVVGYMAFNFAQAFKVDPILSHIKNKLGKDYLNDLTIVTEDARGFQENYDEGINKALVSVSDVLEKLPFPQFIGSNAWVLSPKKTKTGKVILENDVHIGYSQPCVWYQAHIKTPNYERYGFHLGLMPFPLLSHNRDYAMGMTMFENDDLNFYRLKNHPTDSTKYITSTGIHTYELIEKVIKVKGEKDEKIQIKKTVLGTVFNDRLKVLDNKNPIAIQWTYNEKLTKVLKVSHGINHAKNIRDFESRLSDVTAPGLNFVYGDKEDHIGLWSAAYLYKFRDSVNTKFILNGLDSLHTEKEWLPFSKNPKAIDPPKGYVMTSNAQPEAVDGELYQGYYLPKDRAIAIKKGLTKKEKLSVNDVKSLATSHTNTVFLENVKSLLYGIDIEKLTSFEILILDRLVKWKGNHSLDNIGPTIYNKINYKMLKYTFKDELGEVFFKEFSNSSLCEKSQNKYIKNQNSVWWDNINTPEKETFQDIVMKSFQESVKELKNQLGDNVDEWKWRKVHVITHEHALAKMEILKKMLNVAATPVMGGNQTINNTMYDYTEGDVYISNAGPSTRRVVDFSDIENSFAVLPTGQSGNFLSPYYKDQASFYNSGRYYKMLINDKEIKKSKQKLMFK